MVPDGKAKAALSFVSSHSANLRVQPQVWSGSLKSVGLVSGLQGHLINIEKCTDGVFKEEKKKKVNLTVLNIRKHIYVSEQLFSITHQKL